MKRLIRVERVLIRVEGLIRVAGEGDGEEEGEGGG